MSKKQWTIIGELGTIDYLGGDKYVGRLYNSPATYLFGTDRLPDWLTKVAADSDAYGGFVTSEWNS